MAGDKRQQEEQSKQLKDLGKNILELLSKIAPIPKGVTEAYKVSKETVKVLDFSVQAYAQGLNKEIPAFNDNLNKLEEISIKLYDELEIFVDKSENWWIETSGANLFSVQDSTKALQYIQQQSTHFNALKNAFVGLKTLAGVVYASSIANVKGLAGLFMPDIPAIDAMVLKRIAAKYDDCIDRCDVIIKKIDIAGHGVADMNKVVDRFLVLVKSQDQRAALKSIESGKKSASSNTP